MTIVTTRRAPDAGFSVPEALVVLLLIGTLATITVPLYLGHQREVKDVATTADATELGSELRSAFNRGDTVRSVSMDGQWYLIDGVAVVEASTGVELVAFTGGDPASWCVQLRHPDGDVAASPGVRFDAQGDLAEPGACP